MMEGVRFSLGSHVGVNINQTVHLKCVPFVICELYLHKVGTSHSWIGIKRLKVIQKDSSGGFFSSQRERGEGEDTNVSSLSSAKVGSLCDLVANVYK